MFRWRPVSSGGFAHQTTEPIAYSGCVIPKGTQIIGNHWSISRDPAVFPEPEEFRPARWFVDGDVTKCEIRKDINHVGYGNLDSFSIAFSGLTNTLPLSGFGRRICAGKNLADRSVYSQFDCKMKESETNVSGLNSQLCSPPVGV